MHYVTGEDRKQEQLLPATVEDYVAANAPVRAIDAFVESLDLGKLGLLQPLEGTGRPPYHPKLLLKLYLYGYLNRIRSSRRLEAECQRNLELMWLLQSVRPDFWTIAAFRREHKERFKGVFKEFNLLCRKLELFGAELVAIDGAKFKAVNSPRRHWTAQELAELVAQIDRRIAEYVDQLEAADAATADVPGGPSAAELEAKIAELRERRTVPAERHAALVQSGETELALTDPDSRGQKKVGVGYNVQAAVDSKHDLIAAETVVQAANDVGQLAALAKAAQEAIGATNVVADAGYHERGQLQQCEAAGVATYVPAPTTRSGRTNEGDSVYPKERFRYDEPTDSYRCPAGQILARVGAGKKHAKDCTYYSNSTACAACRLRPQCTTASYRRISRLENEPVVERQAQRVAAHPEIVAERKTIVEHLFGTLRMWGYDTFLCRGLPLVQAEFTLSALAYNFRRVLNLCPVEHILTALHAN